jgi:N-methylhydantoinase A
MLLLGVDVGGTFTDAVLVAEGPAAEDAAEGTDAEDRAVGGPHATGGLPAAGGPPTPGAPAVFTAKVPSTPDDQSRGVLEAVRAVLAQAGAGRVGTPERAGAPFVRRFAHGMTVATNALLEGRGARTALVATEGFADLIELGRQARPRLYELCVAGPAPLAPPELRFEAPERMTPEGPLRALDLDAARALVDELADAAPEAVAVALLHSYAHPAHERLLGELIAARLPAAHVSLSHDLVGTFREYERAATTEVDAALSPLVGAYLRRLCAGARALGLVEPAVMQSSGGLTDAAGAARHAALTVLSGPAGGVRGAQLLAAAAGERDVLCFDMGGTSCDVCLIEGGEVAETADGVVAGRPLALATLDIHTVGAGGGSIAWRDPGGALRVGPRSAGADPGPACYGRGGERPTVTDANLLLGRLLADVPLAGGLELDREAARRAVADLAAELDLDVLRCAEGIVRVAEAEMLRALRTTTVQRGIDPRGFALMPFGGAGPLHAAALARELGIDRILCPRASGVLCALGLAAAAPRRDAARTVMLAGVDLSRERLAAERDALVRSAADALGHAAARVRVRYELRYRGQSFELTVEEDDCITADPPTLRAPRDPQTPRRSRDPATQRAPIDPQTLRESFARAHERRYGYRDDGAEVELVTIRASAWGAAPTPALAGPAGEPPVRATRSVVLDGRELEAECLRGELPLGTRVCGPAICALPESTLFVPPGWEGEVDTHGTVRICDTPVGR